MRRKPRVDRRWPVPVLPWFAWLSPHRGRCGTPRRDTRLQSLLWLETSSYRSSTSEDTRAHISIWAGVGHPGRAGPGAGEASEISRRPVRRYRFPLLDGAAKAHWADELQARKNSWPQWAGDLLPVPCE